MDRHTPLSCQELVARAKALQPLLREHAAEGESSRKLPDTVITRLAEAGMFRMPEQAGWL
jgi:3-hydroxy-9,10-secoandrosta-1,3,5(10)-triene-9,17-dione monooxygenase